jgi:hypothetical protein
MNKKLLALIKEKFTAGLQAKTGWGRNEILDLYQRCVAEAALEVLDGNN